MLDQFPEIEDAWKAARAINPGGAKLALLNAQKALRRIVNRAEAAAIPEMEYVEIVQTSGPVLEFTGKLIAQADSGREGKQRWQNVEMWETRAGNLVAVIEGRSDIEGERDLVKASVFEGFALMSIDEAKGPGPGLRRAVMDSLNWSPVARAMVRDQLGWTFSEKIA